MSKMLRSILLALVLVGTCFVLRPCFAFAASTCSQQEIETSSHDVSSTRQSLLALTIGGGLDTDVSAVAKTTIFNMKEAVNRFIAAYMRCLPPSTVPDAAKIQTDLSRVGHSFPIQPGRVYKPGELPSDVGNYGFELTFDVKAVDDARHLVSIKAQFTIECGEDAMLMIFAPDDSSWKEVLRWQSPPYDTVAGAFWAFDYSISPPDSSGNWFVAAKSVMPWCSSTWSSVRYALLRPSSADVSTPSVLLSTEKEIWWGNEDFGTVMTTRDGFEIRLHAASLDAGVHNRVHVFHYFVSASDDVIRTQPVAVSPRDFVDEWIRSPWPEAAQWSNTSFLTQLQASHAAVQQRNDHELFSFDSATRCKGSRNQYEVGISYNDKRRYYLRVSGRTELTMMGVSRSGVLSCKGPDILATMETK